MRSYPQFALQRNAACWKTTRICVRIPPYYRLFILICTQIKSFSSLCLQKKYIACSVMHCGCIKTSTSNCFSPQSRRIYNSPNNEFLLWIITRFLPFLKPPLADYAQDSEPGSDMSAHAHWRDPQGASFWFYQSKHLVSRVQTTVSDLRLSYSEPGGRCVILWWFVSLSFFNLDRLYWSFDCFGTVNLIISFDVLACNMASNLLNDITTLAMTKCFPGSSKIFISLWALLVCLLTCIYVCECTSINGLICLLINLL